MVFFRVYIFRAPIFPFCYLLWTWNHPAYYRTVSDLYNYFTLLSVPTYGTHYTVPYLILKNEFYSNIGDLQAIFVPFIFMFKMSLLQGYFFLSKHFYPPPPQVGVEGGGGWSSALDDSYSVCLQTMHSAAHQRLNLTFWVNGTVLHRNMNR